MTLIADTFRIFFAVLTGFTLLILPMFVQAQKMVPDAPIENFQLPMYGEDGYRIWLLVGYEGRYINASQVDVLGMVLRTFSGDEAMREEFTIRSPEATIYMEESRAFGRLLRVAGEGFALVGKDWTWDGEAKSVIIKRDAVVTFKQNLSNLIQ